MLSCDASLIAQRRTTGRSHHEVPRSSPSRANPLASTTRTEQRARRHRPGFSRSGGSRIFPDCCGLALRGAQSIGWMSATRGKWYREAADQPPPWSALWIFSEVESHPNDITRPGAGTQLPSMSIVARARRVRSAPSRGEPAGPSKSPGACPNAARGMVRSCRQMASDVPPW
jgi:hypothetical protein